MALILEIPLISGENVVAEIYNVETGEHVDSAYNAESALTYIQQGDSVAIAVAADGARSVNALQQLFNHERQTYEDCFGLTSVSYSW